MNNFCLLSVDAGGTFFKYALVTPEYGILLDGEHPACSDGDLLAIEGAWRGLIAEARKSEASMGLSITRVVISTPGPYDFVGGRPLMKHKFTAAYGVSILPWLSEELPGAPVSFLHDSTAFMLGQMFFGAARDAQKPAAVMLGTGFGFACVREGRVMVNALQTSYLPVWRQPFMDGTTEDYVSRRAIRARYQKLSQCESEAVPDVREIAQRAEAGERAAISTFEKTGEYLGLIIRPILLTLGSDSLVLGGQIAKAHALFEKQMLPALPCELRLAQGGQDAALKGSAAFCLLGADKTIEMIENAP